MIHDSADCQHTDALRWFQMMSDTENDGYVKHECELIAVE